MRKCWEIVIFLTNMARKPMFCVMILRLVIDKTDVYPKPNCIQYKSCWLIVTMFNYDDMIRNVSDAIFDIFHLGTFRGKFSLNIDEGETQLILPNSSIQNNFYLSWPHQIFDFAVRITQFFETQRTAHSHSTHKQS